ncbi:MAG: TonB-dependent receptor [Bacteroidales bacterium]|nr:TonB-dependent receptor [Bacteroidales bacterium]
MMWLVAEAQQHDTVQNSRLNKVTVRSHRHSGISRMGGAENGINMGQGELFRAACCNLGESFVNSASVDVNYNDAAVGARQIKLLGLSGQYVQMLNEGLPSSIGASLPYSLGYVPGAWMKSISVSKGASSVKHGPQSITGQINVEYLKPEDDPLFQLNIYGDSRLKSEFNAAVNRHIGDNLSTIVMAHYEHDFGHHDDDGDLWHDSPAVTQFHLQNRWKYAKGHYIMHAGVGYLQEQREGGQMLTVANPFRVLLNASRAEAYMKHAWLVDHDHNTNIALLANGYYYSLDGTFGPKTYRNSQLNFNSRLVLEHDFNEFHNISTGLSLDGSRMDEDLFLMTSRQWNTREIVPGAYAQYTYMPSYKLTAMAGLRADYNSLYQRAYFTPRLHLKWMVCDWMTLRASSGKGFRTPHVIAENHYLLASGRTLVADTILPQEEAWNSGISMAFFIPVGGKNLKLNAEYYYTDFIHQTVVDYDSDPTKIVINDLDGSSFSHTLQVDASYDFTEEFNVLTAFRYNYVRCTYDGILMEKPMTSRYKGLVTLNWKPMMAIWQVDVTLSLNGGGRMPTPYTLIDGTPSWDSEFPAYMQLSAQVTREFRHFSLYVGGENLTGYRQKNPIINASDPWSTDFDPTMIWGPVHGIMVYAGIRMKI